MRPRTLLLVLGLFTAPVLLSGCTAQTALTNALEAGSGVKDYVDEVTDRREKLRAVRYMLQDQFIAILQSKAILAAAGGDTEAAMAGITELDTYIETIYPDLPAIFAKLREIRRALRGEETRPPPGPDPTLSPATSP